MLKTNQILPCSFLWRSRLSPFLDYRIRGCLIQTPGGANPSCNYSVDLKRATGCGTLAVLMEQRQPQRPKFYRRLTARVEAREEAWIYWNYDGRDEFSRITNVGMGGIFIETTKAGKIGAKTKIDFLAGEGHIKAEAVIRHCKPTKGLGLKFTAVADADRRRLETFIKRLSSKR